MLEIAGRLPFSTIKTSNSKSQNDDEILNNRIIWTNYTTQNPYNTAFQVGCFPNAQVNYTHAHTKMRASLRWSLT